ncbi:MAG: hypothetical protein K1W28_05995 [Lachnospiraceae bacterium]
MIEKKKHVRNAQKQAAKNMKYPQLTNGGPAVKLKAVTERDDKRKVTDRHILCLFELLFFFCFLFSGRQFARRSLSGRAVKIAELKSQNTKQYGKEFVKRQWQLFQESRLWKVW